MIKVIHWCALRTSSAAMWLFRFADRVWEISGGVECWADERICQARGRAWAKKHNFTFAWKDPGFENWLGEITEETNS